MSVFQAHEVRETTVYWSVNEDFENECNEENTFLGNPLNTFL